MMITRNISTRVAGLLVCAIGASGCTPPSLLITPVSGRRDLQETVLEYDSTFAFDKIVIIDVSGMIQNSERFELLGRGEQPVSLLLEQLDKARCDSRVKAVILRINSPGGTVVASELMHNEIMHFRETTGKPVIAVQMDVAASGAYFISCACDEIVAQPSTVTGSIGVIMMTVDLSGTLAKIGVSTDAITSGVHKDSGSPFRPMRPEERQLFQAIIDDMYAKFLDVVVAGRPKLTRERIRELADGRVYTATQALENGLIDRIATMRETVCETKERVGARSVKLVTYNRVADYKPNYYAQAPVAASHDVNFLKFDMQGTLMPPTPQFLYLWSPGQ
jgi:protease-4